MAVVGTTPLRNLAETGEILSVSRRTVYRLIGTGALPVVEIAGRTLVREEDIAAFIASRRRRRPSRAP
jgi:excisionase family DNA binding protein